MIAKAIVVDPKIVLEMSLREAEIVRSLLGGIDVTTVGVVAKCVRDLYHALTNAGVNPDTETFSDLFTGKITTKFVEAAKS